MHSPLPLVLASPGPSNAVAVSEAAIAAAAESFMTRTRVERATRIAERLAAASLESLLNAIDANDADTGAHVRRVATSAVLLARAADQDEACQRRVERVALFHDVGKINGALIDVLRVTVALTAAERRLIATHTVRGAEVMAPLSPFFPELPAAILAHHEWWNGRGYPNGLRGTDIPFEARIVALADVFDALTHRRHYKAAFPIQRATRLIAAGRGTQFDPDLTDLFLSPPVQLDVRRAVKAAGTYRPPRNRDHSRAPKGETTPRPGVPEIAFRWHAERDD